MLIVPDIHGRKFWKLPVAEHFMNLMEDDGTFDRKVVFLGDYLDPYPFEGISIVAAMDRFKQIISLKKAHPDDIILLLGNHDWCYIKPDIFYASRHDTYFEDEIHSIFINNIDLFQMIYQCDVANRHYVFSHAGIHPEWMEMYLGITDINKIAELYNQRATDISMHLLDQLTCISESRGGWAAVGSPIWCDVDEYKYANCNNNYYQIFGHTQQEKLPIITSNYACLDCRQIFKLNTTGLITLSNMNPF